MLRRLVAEESGMTMGLAVITMVLVGVMGAGLLTFVNRDLSTVVEVNQGQKALEIAEVGVQEARRQLIADPVRQHYDRDPGNDCTVPRARKGADWSPNTGNPGCGSSETGSGVTRSFGDGQFQVTIECYVQKDDPSTPSANVPCSGSQTGQAPEDVDPRRKSFFKVVSTGLYPNEGGAKRRVEAILARESQPLPLAYYTPKDIDLSGTAEVGGVSFFAGGNITGAGGSSTEIGSEPDLLMGNWSTASPNTPYLPASNYNTVARGTTTAGFGAAGEVCEGNSTSNCKSPEGASSFDSSSTPRLVVKEDPEAANASGTISYPFDRNARPDMELLMEEAKEVGTYYTPSSGSFDITEDRMRQALQGGSTPVVFVDFPGAASNSNNVGLTTEHDDASRPIVLVVRNGNVRLDGRSGDNDRDGYTEFRGVIIVEGNGSTTGTYDIQGRNELAGFVFADGDIKIGGNARAESLLERDDAGKIPPPDFFDRMLAFNRIRLWSWQEVYQ